MAAVENRVGTQYGADGTFLAGRASKGGSTIIGQGQGRYYENASRGSIFHLTLAAWTSTVAAGNINAAAAAASTQFALWNPLNSGKNISLLKFAVFPISGTAPVSGLFHSKGTAPTIASSALTAVSNGLLGLSTPPVAGYMASAAGAALTGGGALTVVRVADLYITAGTVSNLGGDNGVETLDGDIVIPPGMMWVPTWQAAGTTFLGGYSITWEEIAI